MDKDTRTGYCDLDYSDIVKTFSPTVVVERYSFLVQFAKEFIRRKYAKILSVDDHFLVVEKIVGEIVLNYFSDIKRLKDFHRKIDRVDPKKVAAYTAYWVARCKPIQIIRPIPKEVYIAERTLTTVNELYASHLLITMSYDTSNVLHHTNWDNYNKFTKLLYYHLTYRITNPQALELALMALDAVPIYGPLA